MGEQVSEQIFLATKDCSVGGGGARILVTKGEEYKLTKPMFKEALAMGMVPQESLDIKDKEKDEGVDTRTLDEKFEILVEACKKLILGGEKKNFTQLMKPKIGVVREMVDFDFSRRQMLNAYDQAVFKTEEDDNDS